MEEIKPAATPLEALDKPKFTDIVQHGVWIVGGSLILIIIGAIALSIMGMDVPDIFNSIGVLLAGALVSLVTIERMNNV